MDMDNVNDGEIGDGDKVGQKTKQEVHQKYVDKLSKERPSKPPSFHSKFGQPKPLESEKLPTYCELAAAFLHKQSTIRQRESLPQNPPNTVVIDELSTDLEKVADNIRSKKKINNIVKRKDKLRIEINTVIKIILQWRKNKKKLSSKFEKSFEMPVPVFLQIKSESFAISNNTSIEVSSTSVVSSPFNESSKETPSSTVIASTSSNIDSSKETPSSSSFNDSSNKILSSFSEIQKV